jgi:signal transduction histidine kinase
MNKLWQILKAILISAYFLCLIYISINSTKIAVQLGQSALPIVVQIVLYLSIIALLFSYIKNFLKSNLAEKDFATIVNHSFRTPLTRILWTANELKNSNSHTEKQEYVQEIENATNRLLSVVDTFLGIVGIRDVSGYVFKAVSIREIVEESLLKHSGLINKKHLQMQVSIFDKMPLLTADLKRISFVVDVLIENALIYTPENGQVVIDCENMGDKIVFFVQDSGIGFEGKERLKIFSKFYRGEKAQQINPYGMGMGLYLSKVIIKRHGGKIYAESMGIDKGSTFFIELPLNR